MGGEKIVHKEVLLALGRTALPEALVPMPNLSGTPGRATIDGECLGGRCLLPIGDPRHRQLSPLVRESVQRSH